MQPQFDGFGNDQGAGIELDERMAIERHQAKKLLRYSK